MSPHRRNQLARDALDQLLRDGLVGEPAYRQLTGLYPLTRWDWHSLGRWFLIFGAISTAAGSVILLRDIIHFTMEKLAVQLGVAMLALFAGGYWLKQRRYKWAALAVELLGGFALIGLTFTLGIIFSTGGGNWPALLLIDLIVLLVLGYALDNILLLMLCAVVFFTWFGGATGYVSGWGAYWFGMNYPVRFLGAGLAIALAGVIHMRSESGPLSRYRGFAKVWISSGLFLAEMALWLLSIFGNFGLIDGPWHKAEAGELALFNALWAAGNLALLYLGARLGFRMLIGYGATFFIIQTYTLFFAHAAEKLGPLASLIIAGVSALALALWLESRRRARRSGGDVQQE